MNWLIAHLEFILGIGIPIFLGLLYWVGQRMYRGIWGGRKGWSARYRHNSDFYMGNDLQKTLIRGNKLFWLCPFPQKIGDYCQIDLGKEKVISGFYEIDIERDNLIPDEYELRLYNKGAIQETEPNHIARDPIYGNARVYVEFPPIKVQRIEIRIRKPNLDENGKPYHWKIYGFELCEVMFLQHFIRKRI